MLSRAESQKTSASRQCIRGTIRLFTPVPLTPILCDSLSNPPRQTYSALNQPAAYHPLTDRNTQATAIDGKEVKEVRRLGKNFFVRHDPVSSLYRRRLELTRSQTACAVVTTASDLPLRNVGHGARPGPSISGLPSTAGKISRYGRHLAARKILQTRHHLRRRQWRDRRVGLLRSSKTRPDQARRRGRVGTHESAATGRPRRRSSARHAFGRQACGRLCEAFCANQSCTT